jgi:hypothetical protein
VYAGGKLKYLLRTIFHIITHKSLSGIDALFFGLLHSYFMKRNLIVKKKQLVELCEVKVEILTSINIDFPFLTVNNLRVDLVGEQFKLEGLD